MSVQQGDPISKLHLLSLPVELIQLVIDEVDPSDIDNLRLTSRLMSQLAQKRVLSHRRSKNHYAGLGSMNVKRIRQMIEELSNDPGQNFYPRSLHVPDLNGHNRTPFIGLIPQLESVLKRSVEDFPALPPPQERNRRGRRRGQPYISRDLISSLEFTHYRALSALLVIMFPNIEEFVCKETDRWSLDRLARVLDFSFTSINWGMSNRLLGARLSILHLATFDIVNLASLLALPVLHTLQIKHLYKSSMPGPDIDRGILQIQTPIKSLKIGAFQGSSKQLVPVLNRLKCLRTFSCCISDSDLMEFNLIISALHASSVKTLRELTLMRYGFVLHKKPPRFLSETRVALSLFHQLQLLTLPVWYFLPDRQGYFHTDSTPRLVFLGSDRDPILPISNAIPAGVRQLALTETAHTEQLNDLIENLIGLRDHEPQQLLELILLEFPRVPRHIMSSILGRRPLAQEYQIERLHVARWKQSLWDARVILRSVFDLEPFHKKTSALTYQNFKQANDIVRYWYAQAGTIQFPHKYA